MLEFTPLHPHFVAECSALDLTRVTDAATLDAIRAGLDQYAVLVFRNQRFDDATQLAFAERFDGRLHTKTGIAAIAKNRFGNEALTDVSNVGADGAILKRDDRRRQYALANRLWHTDASFEDPPGRYSMLYGHVVPPVSADTQFADMRAAYDALPPAEQSRLGDLQAHHSIAYSRQQLGFEFSDEEARRLAGVVQPLIRHNPNSGRHSLYLAAHCSRIIDWPLAEGRLLLRELIDHATQKEFVYSHAWRAHDFVIYDNRATMHRATRFDDLSQRRELRRITSLDV